MQRIPAFTMVLAALLPAGPIASASFTSGDVYLISTALGELNPPQLAEWGVCPGCDADLDGSGAVDIVDLLTVLSQWGPCG